MNESICFAVYAHSMAGKFAAAKYGVRAMTASKLTEVFPSF